MKENKIVIVTGGNVNPSLLRQFFHEDSKEYFVIGVDKGLETLDALHISPDLCLGDFDSISNRIRAKYMNCPDSICLRPEKDYTDTHIAVLEAIKREPSEIILFGATGTRMDHMMGNIALLKLCLLNNINASIVDEHNRIRMINSQLTLRKEEQYGDFVSLIPYSDKVEEVTLQGFKYDVCKLNLIKEETIGISNELREEEGHIKIGKGYLLIFETRD